MRILRALLFFNLLVDGVSAACACDFCGCYIPERDTDTQITLVQGPLWRGGFYGAVAEQFARFGTEQLNGKEIDNPTGQYLNSSITDLVAAYDFSTRLALQIDVPLIYRGFKRPDGFAIDRGTVSGLGDMSILLRGVAFRYASPARRTFEFEGKNPVAIEHGSQVTASVILLAGLKFPTGDTSRLKEEFHEVKIPGAPESGIHGHDLTLGSGSYDGLLGEQTSIRYKNLFFQQNVQFTLRGDGAHQYHFANDLIWNAGPGFYVVRNRDTTLGLQFVVSGEHKDVDRFRGKVAEDTGITSVFVGPRIVAFRGRFSAELAADFPTLIENTSLQVVADFRLRAGISLQF